MSNFQDSHPPYPSTSKILSFPWPWTSNLKRIPSFPNNNQSVKKSIIQRWLLYVIRSFLQVGFRFQHQLINLVWLSFDFFSFSWSLAIWFCVALYSWVWSYSKILRNFFYLYLFAFLVLILQSTCFICTTWKRKQTMEQQPNRVCEQAKSKQNVTSRQIQIDHVIYYLIQSTNNVMVSLKDEFTIWRQSQKDTR